MKVLNYGSLNVDYVYSVDHIIVGGETQHSSKLEVFSGGKGLNQSIALAKAGVPVYHAGIVGTDGDIQKMQRVPEGLQPENWKVRDTWNIKLFLQHQMPEKCGRSAKF